MSKVLDDKHGIDCFFIPNCYFPWYKDNKGNKRYYMRTPSFNVEYKTYAAAYNHIARVRGLAPITRYPRRSK